MAGILAGSMLLTTFPIFAQEETKKDAVILYTNDVHCAIDDYSKLAAYGTQLEEGYEVLIVDMGDAIKGEVIGNMTEGSAVIDLMNEVGYDYAVPGNHEFDYGMDVIFDLADEICDNAVIYAIGGADEAEQSYGIRTTNMTVNGGKINAVGNDAEYESFGIYTQTLDINGGTLDLAGSTSNAGPSGGIYAAKSMSVNGGVLNSTGRNTVGNSNGIYAPGK